MQFKATSEKEGLVTKFSAKNRRQARWYLREHHMGVSEHRIEIIKK